MDSPPLTARQDRVLAGVCRDYIATGRPVSSSRLVSAHGFSCSSATLRNELAVLERAGLVRAPHHASGRLPTAAGLQSYVDGLAESQPVDSALARAIDHTLLTVAPRVDARLKAAATLLSETADCVAVSVLSRGAAQERKTTGVEVVALPADRGLVVLELADGTTRVHLVAIEPSLDGRDPTLGLREKLRWLFVGRTLGEARTRLEELVRQEEARLDAMARQAVAVGLAVSADGSFDPDALQVTGRPRLLRRLSDQEGALSPMLELLEDYHRLGEVLSRVLARGGDGQTRARVRVGPHDVADRICLIACRVPGPGTSTEGRPETGAIALFGPDRMDFAAVIPLVEYAARALGGPRADLAHSPFSTT